MDFVTDMHLANLPAVGIHGVKGKYAVEDLAKLDSDLYTNAEAMGRILSDIHRSAQEFSASGGRQPAQQTQQTQQTQQGGGHQGGGHQGGGPPTPTPAAGRAPQTFDVPAGGQIYHFPTQQQANDFKKKAGIQ